MTQANPATPLQIDFISDIACPWCAIGLSSLLRALENLGDAVDARIAVHPFELSPDMPAGGASLVDYLGKKYGRTPEQIAETQEAIRERGASVGFTFGPRTRVYNTFDAHRLLHWAGLEGKQLALKLALLRAYHGDCQDVSDDDVLVQAAQSAGLDGDAARRVLQNGTYADDVRAEEAQVQQMGIQSVPAIVFNQQYLISGGQPVETFENAIRQILAEPQQEE
ncbi:DsbA family oxidoreductase [Paraburkholderia bannensis]|uniref:DsbA family oxidoreductase n=1 Tax=Paraburkholderia bannensis TaxID=765414 RepID=UPI00048526BA|nr:DsbA family oxidoreductase [Paraburkholderia bannensis]